MGGKQTKASTKTSEQTLDEIVERVSKTLEYRKQDKRLQTLNGSLFLQAFESWIPLCNGAISLRGRPETRFNRFSELHASLRPVMQAFSDLPEDQLKIDIKGYLKEITTQINTILQEEADALAAAQAVHVDNPDRRTRVTGSTYAQDRKAALHAETEEGRQWLVKIGADSDASAPILEVNEDLLRQLLTMLRRAPALPRHNEAPPVGSSAVQTSGQAAQQAAEKQEIFDAIAALTWHVEEILAGGGDLSDDHRAAIATGRHVTGITAGAASSSDASALTTSAAGRRTQRPNVSFEQALNVLFKALGSQQYRQLPVIRQLILDVRDLLTPLLGVRLPTDRLSGGVGRATLSDTDLSNMLQDILRAIQQPPNRVIQPTESRRAIQSGPEERFPLRRQPTNIAGQHGVAPVRRSGSEKTTHTAAETTPLKEYDVKRDYEAKYSLKGGASSRLSKPELQEGTRSRRARPGISRATSPASSEKRSISPASAQSNQESGGLTPAASSSTPHSPVSPLPVERTRSFSSFFQQTETEEIHDYQHTEHAVDKDERQHALTPETGALLPTALAKQEQEIEALFDQLRNRKISHVTFGGKDKLFNKAIDEFINGASAIIHTFNKVSSPAIPGETTKELDQKTRGEFSKTIDTLRDTCQAKILAKHPISMSRKALDQIILLISKIVEAVKHLVSPSAGPRKLGMFRDSLSTSGEVEATAWELKKNMRPKGSNRG